MSDIALHFDARPSGIPLVLLPAFPLDGRMFRGVRRLLDGWVITVDPPGFGDSAAQAAASITVSPKRSTTAPSAWRAILPVWSVSGRPATSIETSCMAQFLPSAARRYNSPLPPEPKPFARGSSWRLHSTRFCARAPSP